MLFRNFAEIYSTFSSGGFISGVKAIGSSLKEGATSLIAAHPVITALTALVGAISLAKYGAEKNLRNYENVSDSVSDYKNAVSELESINSELDSTIHKIDELNAKDSLTLVEQDELEKLEKTTSNLERQQKITPEMPILSAFSAFCPLFSLSAFNTV